MAEILLSFSEQPIDILKFFSQVDLGHSASHVDGDELEAPMEVYLLHHHTA
jgi:hypothetical protein